MVPERFPGSPGLQKIESRVEREGLPQKPPAVLSGLPRRGRSSPRGTASALRACLIAARLPSPSVPRRGARPSEPSTPACPRRTRLAFATSHVAPGRRPRRGACRGRRRCWRCGGRREDRCRSGRGAPGISRDSRRWRRDPRAKPRSAERDRSRWPSRRDPMASLVRPPPARSFASDPSRATCVGWVTRPDRYHASALP